MSDQLSLTDHEHMDKIVVRTDFSNEAAWQQVLVAIDQPWGGGEFESTSFVVDDRRWEHATGEQIKQALRQFDTLSVVFLADSETMTSPDHPLLAVNLDDDRNYLDKEYDAEHGTTFGRQFRIVPNEASGLEINLAIANMDWEEWAVVAAQSADGVVRDS